mmetsp:Transcript_41886/g.134663  ORF Transcript_41886/g.134663 Transcript_41886/m.134663 type:complete len:218 (+) Transcript_41886:287-940(+)
MISEFKHPKPHRESGRHIYCTRERLMLLCTCFFPKLRTNQRYMLTRSPSNQQQHTPRPQRLPSRDRHMHTGGQSCGSRYCPAGPSETAAVIVANAKPTASRPHPHGHWPPHFSPAVASCTVPTSDGPRKPPRLPTELTTAIDAGASGAGSPPMCSAQKTGTAVCTATSAAATSETRPREGGPDETTIAVAASSSRPAPALRSRTTAASRRACPPASV